MQITQTDTYLKITKSAGDEGQIDYADLVGADNDAKALDLQTRVQEELIDDDIARSNLNSGDSAKDSDPDQSHFLWTTKSGTDCITSRSHTIAIEYDAGHPYLYKATLTKNY